MTWADFQKTLPIQAVAIAIFGMVGALGRGGVLPAIYVSAAILAVLSATGASGLYTLGSPTSNSQLLPHFCVILAAIGLVTALGLEHVLTTGQILGFLAILVPGGGFVAGAINNASVVATERARHLARPDVPE